MVKALVFAVFFHVCLLSFVWVGYQVPAIKKDIVFYYGGISGASDVHEGLSSRDSKGIKANSYPVKEAASLPWGKTRALDKPKR